MTEPTLPRLGLIEIVAEALYERAMSERRVFASDPHKFTKGWRDEPFVPIFEGEPRPKNWRDDWRDEALLVLTRQESDPE